MQLRHATQGEETSSAIRGGDREFKTLLIGDENSPDNYRLVLASQTGKFIGPRHRHNFDQIRMCLSGEGQNYAPDRWIRPGELAYFPEGAYYGPEDSDCHRFGITLQFGGASGNGFVSSRRSKQGMEELKKLGTFDRGVFYRGGKVDSDHPGQDSFEAVWEHVNQRKLEYPKPRYDEPVMIRPDHFEWQDSGPGIAFKKLGCFTERCVEIALARLNANSHGRTSPRSGRQIAFVTSGMGQVNSVELRQFSAFSLEPDECAEIVTEPGLELVLIGLPIFTEQKAVAHSLGIA
jgi:hypothetical protein